MNNKEELRRKIGYLESRIDQLETEFAYIHSLLLECGFPDGVNTLKKTIVQLLAESKNPLNLPPEDDDFHSTQTIDPFA